MSSEQDQAGVDAVGPVEVTLLVNGSPRILRLEPRVTLLLILFLITLLLFTLFLGGSLVAQGYLYQQPAERLPLRALSGAVLVGAFITIWVSIDRAAPRFSRQGRRRIACAIAPR